MTNSRFTYLVLGSLIIDNIHNHTPSGELKIDWRQQLKI